MKQTIALIALVGSLTLGTSAALAQGLVAPTPVAPIAPVNVHAPVVMSQPVSFKVMQTKMLNTYRSVRAFWLSRAIVR